MAQKVKIILVDDLDGGSADETVRFGLDGVSYEIDLSSGNASELRSAVERFVAHARKTSSGRATRTKIARRPESGLGTDPSVGPGQRLCGKQPRPYSGRNSGSLPKGEFLASGPAARVRAARSRTRSHQRCPRLRGGGIVVRRAAGAACQCRCRRVPARLPADNAAGSRGRAVSPRPRTKQPGRSAAGAGPAARARAAGPPGRAVRAPDAAWSARWTRRRPGFPRGEQATNLELRHVASKYVVARSVAKCLSDLRTVPVA